MPHPHYRGPKEERGGDQNAFAEIMGENFPNLRRETDTQV